MTLRHHAISDLMQVTPDDVNELVEGEITHGVSQRLGVPMDDLKRFIEGEGTARTAELFGLHPLAAVDELAKLAGKEGATGILLALLIFKS